VLLRAGASKELWRVAGSSGHEGRGSLKHDFAQDVSVLLVGADELSRCMPGRTWDAGLEAGDEASQPRVPGLAWLGDAKGSSPRLDRFWV
jgi:hypothetical protein